MDQIAYEKRGLFEWHRRCFVASTMPSASEAGPDADPEVTIVSTNPETLDGLQAYLRGAGLAARCTRVVDGCAKLAPASTLAFVVFPDDFPWESVVTTLADFAEQRPRALPVLVTAQPQRFERLTSREQVLIVPRPVWGWKILDAIRAHLDRDGASTTSTKKREGSRAR